MSMDRVSSIEYRGSNLMNREYHAFQSRNLGSMDIYCSMGMEMEMEMEMEIQYIIEVGGNR